MELSPVRMTMTPAPTEYGLDRSYFSCRSGVVGDLICHHVESVHFVPSTGEIKCQQLRMTNSTLTPIFSPTPRRRRRHNR